MLRPGRAALLLLLLLGLGSLAAPAHAENDVATLLKALRAQDDPDGRLRIVRRLITVGGDRAARGLADLVRRDPSAEVRVGAARALGLIKADDALGHLVELVQYGGPRAVRGSVGRALGRREGSLLALRAVLEGRRANRTQRALVLRALAYFRDADSFDVLRAWMRTKDVHLRGEAVRALVERIESPDKRRALIRGVLAGGRTVDELMPALDAAAEVLDPSFGDVLQRVSTFTEPALREASEHLLDNLTSLRAEAGKAKPAKVAPKNKKERYAKDGAPPPTDGPPPLPRVRGMTDTFYVVDVTGSTISTVSYLKERMLYDMQLLVDSGVNVRVGVLLYRGGKTGGSPKPFEVFPLTYDIERLRAFLAGVEAGGVDDRGSRVGAALEDALARASWRWRARRSVHFYADGPVGDLRRARRAIGLHFRADRTRTRFTYTQRTRKSLPREYGELARLGGSGAPEVLR